MGVPTAIPCLIQFACTDQSWEHKRHATIDVAPGFRRVDDPMKAFARICLIAASAPFGLSGVLFPAAAQPSSSKAPPEDTRQTPTAPTHGTVIEAQKLGSVLGIEVRTNAERNVGRIVDLLANRTGQVEAAVVEFGGFLGIGTRKIAIEWPALRLETHDKQTIAVLDMTRDQLRAAPEYKPDQPIVVRKIVPPAPPSEVARPR
jgi:PRC-barrel domain protein